MRDKMSKEEKNVCNKISNDSRIIDLNIQHFENYTPSGHYRKYHLNHYNLTKKDHWRFFKQQQSFKIKRKRSHKNCIILEKKEPLYLTIKN